MPATPSLAQAVRSAKDVGRDLALPVADRRVIAVAASVRVVRLWFDSDRALEIRTEPWSSSPAVAVATAVYARCEAEEVVHEVVSSTSVRSWHGMDLLRGLLGHELRRVWSDGTYTYGYFRGAVSVRWEVARSLTDGSDVIYWDVVDS
jgi:hypothetical protein